MEDTLNTSCVLPLNLQFFAESANGAEGGTEVATDQGGQPEGNEDGKSTSAAQTGTELTKPSDLNSLLKSDRALQSQFDKLMSKALETAKGKWQNEQNMTAEQLAAAKLAEKESTLTQREQELQRRELRATALGTLSEKGLPASLIGCVALDSEEIMAQSLAEAEKAFRSSVDAAVKAKLKGDTPKAGGSDPQAGYASQMRSAMGLK